jgi:hypothetical protein
VRGIVIIAVILAAAAPSGAEDTFGMWQLVNGEYRNYIPAEELLEPFTVHMTLHDPSVFSVAGYEVGIVVPADVLVLDSSGPEGWINFGDHWNHLVGFTTPVPTFGQPVTVLGQLDCLGLAYNPLPPWISYAAASPPSVPGHDGPVIADGVDPDHLIACGYVNGASEVFFIGYITAVEPRHWTGVKALFR